MSGAAKMPKIDHCVGDCFQRVMQMTEPFKTKQQPLELVLPSEDPLDGEKALLKDLGIKYPFSPPLGCFAVSLVFRNIGDHAVVEYYLSISPAIVDTVQAHD